MANPIGYQPILADSAVAQRASIRLDRQGATPIRQIVIDLPRHDIPLATKPRSLCSRVTHGLYNNAGIIALAASGVIIASQTEAGPKLFGKLASGVASFAAQNYEPVKDAIVGTAAHVASFVKDNLPEINTLLSVAWAVPNVWRAGSKKAKAAWLLVGTASAALPYVLKPGFSLQGAWEKAALHGSAAIASVQQYFKKDEL